MRKALLRFLAGRALPAVALWLLLPAFHARASANNWFARAWRSDEGLPDNNAVLYTGGVVKFGSDPSCTLSFP